MLLKRMEMVAVNSIAKLKELQLLRDLKMMNHLKMDWPCLYILLGELVGEFDGLCERETDGVILGDCDGMFDGLGLGLLVSW
jgi:hypothetical protein